MAEVRTAPEAEEERRCWEAGGSKAVTETKGCWRVGDSEAARGSGAIAGLQAEVATAAAVRAEEEMMGCWEAGGVPVAVASPAAVLGEGAECC